MIAGKAVLRQKAINDTPVFINVWILPLQVHSTIPQVDISFKLISFKRENPNKTATTCHTETFSIIENNVLPVGYALPFLYTVLVWVAFGYLAMFYARPTRESNSNLKGFAITAQKDTPAIRNNLSSGQAQNVMCTYNIRFS